MADIHVTLHPSLQDCTTNENQRLIPRPPTLKELRYNRRIKILQVIGVVLSMLMSTTALVNSSLKLADEKQKSTVIKHGIYDRIGNIGCQDISGTTTLYTGNTVSYNTSTGYTGFKCMPVYADEIKYYASNESTYNRTENIDYGKKTVYITFTASNYYSSACAVCMVEGRDSIVVLPGTYECLNSSWTKEYNGYLMTGNTCVDKKMIGAPLLPSDSANLPALRHEVATDDIDIYYENQKVLSCVVCSK